MRENDFWDDDRSKPSSKGGIASALFLCAIAVVLVVALAISASMLQKDQKTIRAQIPVDGLTTGSVKSWGH